MAEQNYPPHVRRPPRHQRRARGNLTYLQFVELVKNLWSQAHPDIPIIATGGPQDAKYPAIMYGLELRQAHGNDPKMRYRETVSADDGSAIIVNGQRFNNIVSFTVVAESSTWGDGAVTAEQTIEAFEDFMQEITPIIKEMGASEFVYSRRYSDNEISRPAEGVVMRKVAYMLTTERVVTTEVERLEAMVVKAHIAMKDFAEGKAYKPFGNDVVKYYAYRGDAPPIFYQTEDDLTSNLITIPYSSFVINDALYLGPVGDKAFPTSLDSGRYYISNVVGDPFSASIKYEIGKEDSNGDLQQVVDFGSGTPDENGAVFYGAAYWLKPADVTAIYLDGNQSIPVADDYYDYSTPDS